MSTRRAESGSEFASEKFASSAKFDRGLLGSMVARRCTVLDDPKDKELIWAAHFLSHRPGGLNAIAAALLENYPEHFGTSEMVKLGKRPGQSYNAEQVRKIRNELPEAQRADFVLRGEVTEHVDRETRRSERRKNEAEHSRMLLRIEEATNDGHSAEYLDKIEAEYRRAEERGEQLRKDAAAKHPNSYPVESFISVCRRAADDDLENSIRRLCLDPACDPQSFAPWYFAGLVDALRQLQTQWIAERGEGLVITAIGKEVAETLEYTAYSRSLTLIEGGARMGKTFSARAWCELHPGHARFIEVPSGNDETSFFRALARGLGIGNFAQYNAFEIRERVESVLLTGDLLLCLDESHRLWPQQSEMRFGFPKRINWIMSMANKEIPICLISTPQFLTALKAKEEKGGWNSAQFQGRLAQYKPLPKELSVEDLTDVAAAQLPEADAKTLRALADYARVSARYLAAIETIAKRARFIASRAGRDTTEAEDVRRAMQESVMPSDSQLVRALESKPATAGRKRMAVPVPEISSVDAAELPEAGSRKSLPVEIPPGRARSLTHHSPLFIL